MKTNYTYYTLEQKGSKGWFKVYNFDDLKGATAARDLFMDTDLSEKQYKVFKIDMTKEEIYLK